jgi:hypothetical protein
MKGVTMTIHQQAPGMTDAQVSKDIEPRARDFGAEAYSADHNVH